MATHKSALKRYRQSLVRRERNRQVKGGIRRAIKRVQSAVEAGDLDTAREWLAISIQRLDKAASKGVIHKNNAARHKSRLARLVKRAAAK
ncbi:MAG: 30S ribosomal protein S20 [Clostridia bacterium]|nr:MAG: 30S ribosomal protein S20 [Clostridia bacterium]